jgi:ABC-type sugar transport system ATPase subunit
MFRIVSSLVEQNMAVVLISSDLDEVLNMSHQIAVYRDGRILSVVPAESITMDELLQQLTGAQLDEE